MGSSTGLFLFHLPGPLFLRQSVPAVGYVLGYLAGHIGGQMGHKEKEDHYGTDDERDGGVHS